MLDGKAYSTVFRDEDAEVQARMRSLFDKMMKLEEALCRHIEELRAEATLPGRSKTP